MRTLDRYICATFLKNFFLAVSALVFIYFFQELLAKLIDKDFSAQQIVIHTLMGIPTTLTQMIPPAVLIATVLTLSGLNRTAELTACFSIGVGLRRVVSNLVLIAFMISCFTLVLQDRILPPIFKKRTNYYWREMKRRTDFFIDVKQDKIWYRSKNLIYNLRTFDAKSRTIHGMSVYTFDEKFNVIQLVDANKAIFTPHGWRLMDGTVTVFSKDDPFPLTKHFDQKELLIGETPQDFQEIEKEVDGLRLKELYHYVQRTKNAGADTKGYEVKLHSRISLSFIPIIMCVLGVPFSTRNRREGGVAKDLGLCLGVTFFYWLFYSVGLSLGSNGALPPILAAWLPSVIFAGFAVLLISRQRT